MKNTIGLAQAGQYEIRVKGALDARWQIWFEGMTITTSDDETLIRGTIADQAALYSILLRIRDLGLPLMALNQIEAGASSEETIC